MTRQQDLASSGVVQADRADIDVLAQVIADAFLNLAPSRWLIPDPAARRQIFPAYFRLHVEHAIEDGLVYTTPGRTAVALWLLNDATPQNPPGGYRERLAAVTGEWVSRFVAFEAELDWHHPTGFAHDHLAILAVSPDRQRRGTGTALLRAHNALLDRDAVPAYLEASDPGTRAIYLRNGYADHGAPIRLPDGPAMYPMIRHPRERQSAQ